MLSVLKIMKLNLPFNLCSVSISQGASGLFDRKIQISQSGVYSFQTNKCGRVEDGGVLFSVRAVVLCFSNGLDLHQIRVSLDLGYGRIVNWLVSKFLFHVFG